MKARKRRCRVCGVLQPVGNFRKGGFGPLHTCKSCQRKAGYGGKSIAPKRTVARSC